MSDIISDKNRLDDEQARVLLYAHGLSSEEISQVEYALSAPPAPASDARELPIMLTAKALVQRFELAMVSEEGLTDSEMLHLIEEHDAALLATRQGEATRAWIKEYKSALDGLTHHAPSNPVDASYNKAIYDALDQFDATITRIPNHIPSETAPEGGEIQEVSPGTYLPPIRAAAEAMFRDLTNGWVITSQNGIIDCIEEHMKAYNSSILADLALARSRAPCPEAVVKESFTTRPEESGEGCTRSHPHENMGAVCIEKTKTARVENHLARTEAEVEALREALQEAVSIISPLCPLGNIHHGAHTKKICAALARQSENKKR